MERKQALQIALVLNAAAVLAFGLSAVAALIGDHGAFLILFFLGGVGLGGAWLAKRG